MSWSQVLLLNGNVVRSESEGWQQEEQGVAFYFFEAQGGWPVGDYEVRFFIGDNFAISGTFRILN